ncbi:MAG: GDYXXLXY domain-containing protein [Pseudomonadota bacterium]
MTPRALWTALARWPFACALLALLQTGAIGWMTWDRISILRSGTEITLTPEPVDPRDLFRGDYVILSYPIGLPPQALETAETRPSAAGVRVWARIEQDDDGLWRAVELADVRPDARPAGAPGDGVWLRARADGYRDGGRLIVTRLNYGLERYYVPEGEGRALEDLIGERRLQVLAAVDGSGRAAIKGLRVDGETVYEEPWF